MDILDKIQDRNSVAWLKLCEYVDKLAKNNSKEFAPYEELGSELYSQIYTLPPSISKLKSVEKIWLYGSSLKWIPPEIGKLENLEYFDPYTSYNLHWFPYEITYCKKMKDSRVSTRALYGNYKNRMRFPDLTYNPVRYFGEKVKCSVCKKEMEYTETNQLWITLRVGTDDLPLLVNVCSDGCMNSLPKPREGYVQYAHKGGKGLQQPTMEEWERAHVKRIPLEECEIDKPVKLKPLKLIRKIWDK